jgi:hypothetical protein
VSLFLRNRICWKPLNTGTIVLDTDFSMVADEEVDFMVAGRGALGRPVRRRREGISYRIQNRVPRT